MNQSASWMARMIVREVEGFERELALFPDDATVWACTEGVTNSAGTLTLHVCGNLRHFIGAVIGGDGYVRDRDLEFSSRGIGREALQGELRRAREVVERVLPGLSDETLALEFPEAVGGVRMLTGMFLTHLCAHTAFHLGQAGYLRRMVTAKNQSASPVPLKPLAI